MSSGGGSGRGVWQRSNRHRPGRAGPRPHHACQPTGEVPLELRAEGLAFTITFTPPDSEGWMWCNAIVDAPGFRGAFDFQMLRADLDHFRTQLSASVVAANWPCDVRLASTEPGIDLSF